MAAQGLDIGEPRLGLEHPIVAAPMAGVTTPELAAAVSEAGGLGVLALAVLGEDAMREEMERARARTSGPLGLNLFANPAPPEDGGVDAARGALAPLYEEAGIEAPGEVARPGPAFGDDRLELVLELAPDLASFHFGLPSGEQIERLRGAGIVVATSANTVAEAVWAAEAGADVVIAQGAEAGGHRGTLDPDTEPVGTLALVPQVVDAIDRPVIAAGGIADGRGVAAVLALGAVAAQVGTAYIPCPESAADEDYRTAVLSTDGEATLHTRAFSGRPARARRNRLTEAIGPDAPIAAFPLQRRLTVPLGAAGPEYRSHWMGQAARLSRAEPAAAVTERLVAESRDVLGALGGG